MYKTYRELIGLSSFEDRFDYLKIDSVVGDTTFGGHRYLNQQLYKSDEWKSVRRHIIIRDDGNDLGLEGHPIQGSIYIHHINPITIEDILENRPCVFDFDNLICVSFKTHNAIHYGSEELLPRNPITRHKYDTCPWR